MALLWWLQVWRWSQQYESQLVGNPLPEMQQLSAWLKDHVPADDEDSAVGRISHGDFRWVRVLLDKNCIMGRLTCQSEQIACGAHVRCQPRVQYGHSSCLCHSSRTPAMPTASGRRQVLLLGHQQQRCIPCAASSSQAFMICEPAHPRNPYFPPAPQGQLSLSALHLSCPADWTTWFCTPSRQAQCWLSLTGSYPPWATLWQIWPTAQCPTAWHLGPWGWPASPTLCQRVRRAAADVPV